jgi:hypothetical protein
MSKIIPEDSTTDTWRTRLRAFARGAGSIFDIMPGGASTLYRPPAKDGLEADGRALAEDWRAVGDDLRAVMGDFQVALDAELASDAPVAPSAQGRPS